jgi:hypothetical protein
MNKEYLFAFKEFLAKRGVSQLWGEGLKVNA